MTCCIAIFLWAFLQGGVKELEVFNVEQLFLAIF